jgi:hypothetical protein
MRFRKLRIAWSVTCGVLCLLLIVLWVRSYWWDEVFFFPAGGKRYHSQSWCGRIVVGRSEFKKGQARNVQFWRQPVTSGLREIAHIGENVLGFKYLHSPPPSLISVTFPDWFLVSVFATVAVLPWIRKLSWRFSLRTLLIATTLVAVMLGLVVWAAR